VGDSQNAEAKGVESGDYPHVRVAQSEVSLYPHIWRPEGLLRACKRITS
jgi:hypothetical protein